MNTVDGDWLLRRLLRHHLGGGQLLLLGVYSLLPVLVIAGLRHFGVLGLTTFDRTLILLVVAEILVCWMMADFVFPEMKRLRETRCLRDLSLTRWTTGDLRRAFLKAGILLSLPLTAVFMIDGLLEWRRGAGGLDPIVYHPVSILALLAGLPATALLSTALCFNISLGRSTMGEGPLWAFSLLHLAGQLALVALLVAIPALVLAETTHVYPALDVGIHLVMMVSLVIGIALGIRRLGPGWLLLLLNVILLVPAAWLLAFVLHRFPDITAPLREIPRLPFAVGLLVLALPAKVLFWWLGHRRPLPAWPDVLNEEDR